MNGYFYFSNNCDKSKKFNELFKTYAPGDYKNFKLVNISDKRNKIPPEIKKTPALAINVKGQWSILQGMRELEHWLSMVVQKPQQQGPPGQLPKMDPENDPRLKDTRFTHTTDLGYEGLDSSGIGSDFPTLDLAYMPAPNNPNNDPNKLGKIPFFDNYEKHDMNFKDNSRMSMQGNRAPQGNQNGMPLPPELRPIDPKGNSGNETEMKLREYQAKRGEIDQRYGIKSNSPNGETMSRFNN